MKIIIDNEHTDRRPDAPVPHNFTDSVPSRSDSIQYFGDVFHGAPYVWGEFPDQVAVSFKRLSRLRTWVNCKQIHIDNRSGGNESITTTEGIAQGETTVNQWEQTLGVKVGVDWGVFSASVSAALTRRNETSVSMTLSKSISKTTEYNFNDGPAEIAIWQLEEALALERWVVVYNIPGADPAKVTSEMILNTQAAIEAALREGKKPKCRSSSVLPEITSFSDQYFLTSYPSLQDITNNYSVARALA